ncbi:glycosyltransferase family 2 protein [Intestinibacillus sp. Marseille-P6563]|mgnify:CR=1 FL=1|uniref:glycosyltransferase family 2 protein n=1 Tax=Intestinibacillus sp. Marseille-P6563 TaxID=2364792 RepID=UPI0013DFCC3C|nr:glycosyltransferase family 2 protein [Intestinibacillus sp. Marseille-P6563]
MTKCIVYTYAYNAEKTIKRTIDSVLAQTYSDFIYYVVDNGSTDSTYQLIENSAKHDSRIIPLRNEKNHIWISGNYWFDIIYRSNPNDFFCFIDADDAYKPDFLKKSLDFIQKNQLDIAVCGSDLIDSKTNQIQNIRKLSSNLILEGQGFSYYFPLYHQFMRTMWAKIYRMSLLQKFDFSRVPMIYYGGDTLFATENFRNASRVGILAESLHEYYVFEHSVSYQYDSDRLRSPEILYQNVEHFLQGKCSQITPRNQDFLLCVYLGDLQDALRVLWNTPITDIEKLSHLLVLFDSQPLRLLLQADHLGDLYGLLPHIKEQRYQLFSHMADWMLTLDEVPDEQVERFCQLGELLCASITEAEKWICFRNLHIQYLRAVDRTQEASMLE